MTAIREVLEEAGVLGKLGRSLGVFEVRVGTICPRGINHAHAFPCAVFRSSGISGPEHNVRALA